MSLFAMPDGRRFHSVNIKQYYVLGNRIVILSHDNSNNNNVLGRSNNNGTLYNYNAGDNTTALFIQNQIDVAMLSTATSIITIVTNGTDIPPASLTWTSIAPNTGSAGIVYTGVITGTGFSIFSSLTVALLGTGSSPQYTGTIVNDTTINVGGNVHTLVADTYDVTFSTDGISFSSTGLIVTIT